MIRKKVQAFIGTHQLINPGEPIIVGLSGGPDSVCLLSLLVELVSEPLVVAHVDHQWRTTSKQDAHFCRALATKWSLDYHEVQAVDIVPPKTCKGSREAQARLIRRTFFEQVAQQYGSRTIALGHQRDDQQETFFLRLMRGAHVTGLCGIRPRNGLYIRPLLAITKAEILQYLADHKLPYCIDETNTNTTYTRNALRQRVLPALKACDSRFNTHIERAMSNLQETDDFLDRLTKKQFAAITTQEETTTWLNVADLFATDPFLHGRLILHWLCTEGVPFVPTSSFLQEILTFLKNGGASHQLHPTWTITTHQGKVTIKRHYPIP